MEAAKGVIFGHDKTELGYKYLVGIVLITDEPLDLVSPTGETIVMGGNDFNNITAGLQSLTKYKPPHNMGDLSGAVIEVSNWLHPDNLEKVKPPKKKKNER